MMNFTISGKELSTLLAWKKKQDAKTRKIYKGAIGGEYTFSFSPTSIGVGIHVANSITKEMIDITDYDSW
jgi:hypothetical protein